MDDMQAGIEVKTTFFPLAFLLYFFKPKFHVDGGPPIERPWGVTVIPVAPGQHVVRAYVPYLFFPTLGDISINVDVPPGQVVRVQWTSPWLVFLSGNWKILGARGIAPTDAGQPYPQQGAMPDQQLAPHQPMPDPQAAQQPANWYADPTGRHELRYFDGSQWTVNVSDAGHGGTDPI